MLDEPLVMRATCGTTGAGCCIAGGGGGTLTPTVTASSIELKIKRADLVLRAGSSNSPRLRVLKNVSPNSGQLGYSLLVVPGVWLCAKVVVATSSKESTCVSLALAK